MEVKDFILETLNETNRRLMLALDGLTQDEVKWRPGPEANSMGFILWHLCRIEDALVQERIKKGPHVWVSEKWCEKLNVCEDPADTGGRYTVEQLVAFRTPALKDLLAYGEAVRKRTLEYLKSASPARFEEVVRINDVNYTVGGIFGRLLCELNQHSGQIAYLRGLQRGMNK